MKIYVYKSHLRCIMICFYQGRRSVFDIGDDLVAHQHKLRAQRVSEGDVPSQKLESFVFLQLKSCNLVNTFRRKFRAGDG